MKIASIHPTQWVPEQLISVKPHFRGWLHLVATPLSLAASIVLVCLAPSDYMGLGCLPCRIAHPVRHLGALPPFLLGSQMGDAMAQTRPFKHFPADRRHLHTAGCRPPVPA